MPAALEPRVAAPVGLGRVAKAALTWASGAAYTLVTIAIGLVTTPIIVSLLGESRFGAFRAMSDWMGYLQLADLGLGTAFGVLLVRAHARGPQASSAVLIVAVRTLSKISLIALPFALALAWLMPTLVRDSMASAYELRISALVSGATLFFGPWLAVRSYHEASQRGYVVNAALLAQSLVVTALSLLLAWRGFGLIGQSVAALIGLAVFVGALCWSARDRILEIVRRTVAAMPVGTGELWSLSWPLAAAGAGNRINVMTDTIVVGRLLGGEAVAALFLTQRLLLLSASQVNGLANATWPGLAELRQRGERALFEQRLAQLARFIVGLGVVLVGTIGALNAHFVQLWVGPHLYGGDTLAAATVASSVVFGFLLPFSWAIDMAGDTRHRLAVSTIGSLLNLSLSIWCVRRFGLAGVALGTLSAYLLTDGWYSPWLVCRRYQLRFSRMIGAAARGLAAGLPWTVTVWLLVRWRSAPVAWLSFLGEAVPIGLAALLYCWMVVLTSDDRREWVARLRGRRG